MLEMLTIIFIDIPSFSYGPSAYCILLITCLSKLHLLSFHPCMLVWKSVIAYSDVIQLCMTSSMHFRRTLTSGHLEIKWSVFSSASSQILQIPLEYFIFFRCNSVFNCPWKIFQLKSLHQYIYKIVWKPFFPINIHIIECFYSNILSTWFLLVCLIIGLHIYPSKSNRLMISLLCWEYQIAFLVYQSYRLIQFLDECLTCLSNLVVMKLSFYLIQKRIQLWTPAFENGSFISLSCFYQIMYP